MSAASANDHPARHTNGRFGPGNPAPRAALIEPDGVLVDHATADPAPPRTALTVINGETGPEPPQRRSGALRAPHLRCLTVRRGPNHADARPPRTALTVFNGETGATAPSG